MMDIVFKRVWLSMIMLVCILRLTCMNSLLSVSRSRWNLGSHSKKNSWMWKEMKWFNFLISAIVVKLGTLQIAFISIAWMRLSGIWRKISYSCPMRNYTRRPVIPRELAVMSYPMAKKYKWATMSVSIWQKNYSKIKRTNNRIKQRPTIKILLGSMVYSTWLWSQFKRQMSIWDESCFRTS